MKPRCVCKGRICGKDRKTYVCFGCARDVPWCFGAGDENGEFCDDCAAQIVDAEADEDARQHGRVAARVGVA